MLYLLGGVNSDKPVTIYGCSPYFWCKQEIAVVPGRMVVEGNISCAKQTSFLPAVVPVPARGANRLVETKQPTVIGRAYGAVQLVITLSILRFTTGFS